jgi:outer membrane protein assembly factor BamA
VLTLAWGVPSHADVLDYVGRPVASVRLTVDGRDTAELELTRVVDVHVGEPFSMRDVRETVLHLFALARFDDVRVDAEPHGAGLPGVDVRFEMTSAKPVNAIQFAGNVQAAGVDLGQLRRAVTDRAGVSPPLTRADELYILNVSQITTSR